MRLDITVRQRWREIMHGLYPSADLRRLSEQVNRCYQSSDPRSTIPL